MDLEKLPETIVVNKDMAKPRRGAPTTIEKRRNSQPVRGKVKGKRDHYSEKEKLDAICKFAITGNSRLTAELTRIPEATIRSWKTTAWWAEAMARVIQEKDEELTTSLTSVIDKAVLEVNDRLNNGNYIYDAKRGQMVRKPIDAKELAIVTAIAIDKRQLIRGEPTSRTENVSQNERLKGLQEQFKKFVTAKEVKQVEDVIIEAEVVEEDEYEEDLPTVNEMFGEV